MLPRYRRLILILLVLLGVAGAVALALKAFQANVELFKSPTELIKTADKTPRLTLGGLVKMHSWMQKKDLIHEFVVTDGSSCVTVSYTGILPDLFRPGQAIVAKGRVEGRLFVAAEVLAKHDENYTPPQVEKNLRAANPNEARETVALKPCVQSL